MPQLDFANPLTIAQVVWMALIFGGLYLLLARWALPQVASVVESRAHRITVDLDSARIAKAESDSAIAEVTEATRKASADAQAAIGAAIAHAKAEASQQARADDERLTAQLAQAEQRIGAARVAAMGALRQVATETAETVILRLTGQPAAPGAVATAIGNAMTARS